jgi:circadian clock protein KaiC
MRKANEQKRTRSGVPGLDDVLNGGFLPHRLYLIEGDPGAGKTTLALQFLMQGVKEGHKSVYITLSETKEELLAGAASHGWSLDGIEIVELTPNQAELDVEEMVTMYHPSEVELTETSRRILEAVDRINPTLVAFDSLSEMRLLAQNGLRYRRQILALKQLFVGRQCTVLLLDDRTSDDSDIQLESLAHGVLSLEQSTPAYGPVRRTLLVRKLRGAAYRGGLHDFQIRRGGIVVFPRLVAVEHGAEFKRTSIASGVTALDKLLGGGPDRGTSTLLLGPAGSGKSTVAFQYAAAAASRGDHAAIFTFDENESTLRARAAAMGIRFKEGSGPGELTIRQIDPAEVSPGQFAMLVREFVEANHAKVVVIDSLNGYLHAMPQERFLNIHLHELLTYLSRLGVTTMMVIAQHGLMGVNMQTPVDTSYLADSVVLFRYFEHDGKVKKAISVVKKRSGPHEDTIREMWFDDQGIHLSEPLRGFRGVLTGVPVEREFKLQAADDVGGDMRAQIIPSR